MESDAKNGDGMTTATAPPPALRPMRPRIKPRTGTLLYKMIGVAVLIHLVIVLTTSRSLFFNDQDSPEQIFERGEQAMAGGKYLEALDHYQRVLEMQPKLPPVFERAAEQHRNADKLAKQQAAKLASTQPAKTEGTPSATTQATAATTKPAKVNPETATKPDFVVPPEFRK